MLQLECMGMDEVLPAVVVGFEVDGDVLDRAIAIDDPPDGVLVFDQQAGGLSMSYPCVVGAALPLAVNADRGGDAAAHVIRGLRAMAEDPDVELLAREFPALRSAVLTWGKPYDRAVLDRLHAFVRRAFLTLPAFQSGIEAFVRCAPAEPLAAVRGWRAFSCALRESGRGITVLDEASLRTGRADLVVDDRLSYDDRLHAALCATGARIGAAGEPRLHLLWTNSD